MSQPLPTIPVHRPSGGPWRFPHQRHNAASFLCCLASYLAKTLLLRTALTCLLRCTSMQPEYTFKILEKLLASDIRMTLRRVIRPIIQQMTALCYYEGCCALCRRTHAERVCTSAGPPMGNHDITSPKLAGKDVMIFLLLRRRTRALGSGTQRSL